MKTLVCALAVAAVVTGLTSGAQAKTDLERVQGLALKYAAPSGGVPKGLCVCTADNNRIGVLRFFPSDTIGGTLGCYRVGFGSNGTIGSEALCTSWFPLAR